MDVSLPEHFEDFADAQRQGFLRVKELKDQGYKICGAFCSYTPDEIIRAAGMYMVGLCGRSNDPIRTAETRLPANLCPLIKASYGHALEDSCPYAFFSDLIVGETTCDGKKKMYELLREIKDMHVLHLPNIPDHERSLDMWVRELQALRTRLEKSLGITITDDMLNASIEQCNRERAQTARIYELGRSEPPAITGIHMRDMLDGGQFIFDKAERRRKVAEILDQCEKNWQEGNYPYPIDPFRPRIVVSGMGLGGASRKIVDVVEELGGAVVCFEGCGGIAYHRRAVDEDRSRDPIVRIAEKYLDVPCAVMAPNEGRMQQVANSITEWNADGVISVNLSSCLPFSVEAEHVQRVCQAHGVHQLRIETDFSPSDEGQIRTRIEAFLEILRAGKEARHG